MTGTTGISLTRQSLSPKVNAIETSLQESLNNFKDLKFCIEELCNEVEKYKSELISLQEKCESQNCPSSESLKKFIAAKDSTIQLIASSLTRLNETKNFAIINEIFTIIFKEHEESSLKEEMLSTDKKKAKTKRTPVKKASKNKSLSPKKDPVPVKKEISNSFEQVTIKKEKSDSLEDVSFKDDSVSEIESTPTRRSPIMFPKKLTCKTNTSSPDYGDKKKCPNDWLTSESKSMKLIYTNPPCKGSTRLRQSKLTTVVVSTPPALVDLGTLSQHLGPRGDRKSDVQALIRKESSDNDDTIMPSPTSGPNNCLLTKTTKENIKPKKQLSLKHKYENSAANTKTEDKDITPTDIAEMEESINSLNSNKITIPKSISPEYIKVKSPLKACDNDVSMSVLSRPLKVEADDQPLNNVNFTKPKTPVKITKAPAIVASPDATVCDVNESMSLLRPVKMETDHQVPNSEILNYPSPKKRPLHENINAYNVPSEPEVCTQASVSILASDVTNMNHYCGANGEVVKRKTPEKIEPVYKEPTVRKKAEKMALPAWCCHECEVFFGALYKNDPDRDEKIANTIKNCSKHRGRNNPVRPKTPPGFWYPRWDVPQDTEEFNRRNNAV